MLADPRNDTHALVSQLTVLFQLLHNHVLTLIENAVSGVSAADPRASLHTASPVRAHGITLIYRAIIRNDVLDRILHPSSMPGMPIRRRSIAATVCRSSSRSGVPPARWCASRTTNSLFKDQPTDGALEGSSLAHFPGRCRSARTGSSTGPLLRQRQEHAPNSSTLIAPRHPPVGDNTYLFPAIVPRHTEGLLHRDF